MFPAVAPDAKPHLSEMRWCKRSDDETLNAAAAAAGNWRCRGCCGCSGCVGGGDAVSLKSARLSQQSWNFKLKLLKVALSGGDAGLEVAASGEEAGSPQNQGRGSGAQSWSGVSSSFHRSAEVPQGSDLLPFTFWSVASLLPGGGHVPSGGHVPRVQRPVARLGSAFGSSDRVCTENQPKKKKKMS